MDRPIVFCDVNFFSIRIGSSQSRIEIRPLSQTNLVVLAISNSTSDGIQSAQDTEASISLTTQIGQRLLVSHGCIGAGECRLAIVGELIEIQENIAFGFIPGSQQA